MLLQAPDVETSTEGYARRFSGPTGRYLLDVQAQAVTAALRDLPPGRALDVGGGHGQLVGVLASLGWDVTVAGSDRTCGERLPRDVPFVVGDLLRLPFPSRSFDLVISVRLLSHVREWPLLLRELCRLARRSVAFDYPSLCSINVLTPVLFHIKKRIEGNTRTYMNFSRAELASCLRENGFEVARTVGQFVLPMGVHRALRGAKALRLIESGARAVRLTDLVGSPVLLRADRAF